MNKKIQIIAFALVPAALFAFKMPEVPGVSKKEKAPESESSQVDASLLQDALVRDYVASSSNISMAQEKLLEAYGQKELAAKLQTLREEVLTADEKPSKQDLKRQAELAAEANSVIEESIEREAELTEEGKALYAEAIPYMVKGAVGISKLSKGASDFADNAQDEIKAAGMMGAAKVKSKLDVGLYVAPKIPKLIGSTMKTSKMLISYGKKAKVLDADAQYEDALEDADGPA